MPQSSFIWTRGSFLRNLRGILSFVEHDGRFSDTMANTLSAAGINKYFQRNGMTLAEIMHFAFFQRAIIAGTLIAILCSVLGRVSLFCVGFPSSVDGTFPCHIWQCRPGPAAWFPVAVHLSGRDSMRSGRCLRHLEDCGQGAHLRRQRPSA